MELISLSKFVDDIRGIVQKYRTEAAHSLNISIIHGEKTSQTEHKRIKRIECNTLIFR